MFHKFAITLNCFLLVIPFFVYCLPPVLTVSIKFAFWLLQSQFSISKVLLLLSFLILMLFFSFLFITITSLFTDITVGKPPMGNCIIAYKYGLSDSVTGSAILSDELNFPTYEKIHICYERKGSLFGMAHGAIISDKMDENIKAQFVHQGYNIFQAMSASNAVYISCPTLPWLSYVGIWIILRIVYPRFYKYSKVHRLSAYPVVELYRRFSLILMAPLSQQDLFLVPEAESLLNRSCSGTSLTLNSSVNLSCSTLKHSRSRTVNSISTAITDNNNDIKPQFIHTSTPIPSNGTAKEGYED